MILFAFRFQYMYMTSIDFRPIRVTPWCFILGGGGGCYRVYFVVFLNIISTF